MNRKITWITVVILFFAVLFVFLDPMNLFIPRVQPLIEVDEETSRLLSAEIEAFGQNDPSRAIGELFTRYPVVLAGELGAVAQEVNAIRDVIPDLPAMGVHILGLDVLLAEDQTRIDQLINADSFDEYLAQELLFNRLVTWGYREYVDLLRAAWQTNKGSEGRFRVLGLSMRMFYDHIRTVEDFRDPVKLRQVLRLGNPDEFTADVIGREIVQQGENAFIFAERERIFTDFLLTVHAEEMISLSLDEQRQTGLILRERYGDLFATVLFHSPWPTSLTNSRAQYPVDGIIDAALDRMETNEAIEYPIVLPVWSMPLLSAHPIQYSNYALGYNGNENSSESLYFGQMADVYIIPARIHDLTAVTSIENFIDDEREQRAVENFPGSRYADADAEDVNNFIRRYAEDRGSLLHGFNE